jgi:hypothetical protein
VDSIVITNLVIDEIERMLPDIIYQLEIPSETSHESALYERRIKRMRTSIRKKKELEYQNKKEFINILNDVKSHLVEDQSDHTSPQTHTIRSDESVQIYDIKRFSSSPISIYDTPSQDVNPDNEIKEVNKWMNKSIQYDNSSSEIINELLGIKWINIPYEIHRGVKSQFKHAHAQKTMFLSILNELVQMDELKFISNIQLDVLIQEDPEIKKWRKIELIFITPDLSFIDRMNLWELINLRLNRYLEVYIKTRKNRPDARYNANKLKKKMFTKVIKKEI